MEQLTEKEGGVSWTKLHELHRQSQRYGFCVSLCFYSVS